ncbi:MAG: oligosaccharide flippase family protein, partial [Opitutales bacterium]
MKGLAAGTKRLRGRGLGSALATSGTDALIFAIQLLQSVLTARALLPEGRGQLTTILIWPAFIFGFIAGGMRFTIIYFVGTYPEKRETVIWFGYVATVTLATLAAVFNYALAGLLLTDSDELVVALVQIAGIFQPLLAVTTYASILLQAERRYKIWNAFRILDPLLFTIGVAVALLLGHADLLTITVIFLAARVPILLAMLPFVKLAKEGRAWDGSLFREMAVYFSKVLPTGWMAQANAQLDQMVLS